jgi:hypothetical protein
MNPHLKGLLSLFWRMVVFVPVSVLGLATLVVVLGLTAILPMYAFAVFIDGRYLLGLITLVAWLAWLRFGGRLRHLVFEGFGHGSL